MEPCTEYGCEYGARYPAPGPTQLPQRSHGSQLGGSFRHSHQYTSPLHPLQPNRQSTRQQRLPLLLQFPPPQPQEGSLAQEGSQPPAHPLEAAPSQPQPSHA